MLKLHAITAHHYKSFEPKARLELRPLTLLLGRNNAGKSSLLRLLPILARSADAKANATLNLTGPECRGNPFFQDYVWSRGTDMTLELEWRDGARKLCDRYTLRYAERLGSFIHELTILEDDLETFSAHATLNDDATAATLRAAGVDAPLLFRGLRPEEDTPHDALRALRKRLGLLNASVQWLCSNRVPPPRNVDLSVVDAETGRNFILSHDGSNAANILHSHYAPFKDLTDRVAAWYQHKEIGRTLRAQPLGDKQFHISLDKIGQEHQKFQLLDAGEGMAQVLPVLVAAELARMAGPASILAIEDPEDQLHENARAALAQHLAALASPPDAPSMVLETHSRTFLLGVQLAIAQGILPPEHVIAYWIAQGDDGRSVATPVTFNKDGSPTTSALTGLLAEDRVMARELLALQLNAAG
jgi:hypothetical protein